MTNQLIIMVSTVLIISSLLWLIYIQTLKNKIEGLKNKCNNLTEDIEREIFIRGNKNIDELNSVIFKLKSEMAESRHSHYMEGYDKAKSEFFLNVTPYYEENKVGKDGFIMNDIRHVVNIGYRYQLYINNIPVLEPTIRWERKLEEKKVTIDHEKIKSALDIIEKSLLPIVAQSNGILRLVSVVK